MHQRKWLTPLIIIAVAFLLGLFPLSTPDVYWLSMFFIVLVFVSLTVSWNIIGGYAGYLSFAHAGFFGIGLYTTSLLLVYLGWSPFYGALVGGVVAAVFALLVGYPTLRLKGPYFALITLIFPLALKSLILNLDSTGGSVGFYLRLPAFDIFTSRTIFYEAMLLITALVLIIAWSVEKSKFGLGLFAIREDEEAAQTVGIKTTRLKMGAFALSSFLAAVIGGIYGYYSTYVNPEVAFNINWSLFVVLMALFGGRDSWMGAALGAAVLTLLSEQLKIYAGAELSNIIYGVLLALVIIYLPNGVMGYIQTSIKTLQRRIAGSKGKN